MGRHETSDTAARRIPPWMLAVLVWGVLPALLLAALGAVLADGIPSVEAAQGSGTQGYFLAQSYGCVRASCNWTGQFKSGADRRSGVTLLGSYPGIHAGDSVPALDSGDPFGVFPRHGNTHWLTDLWYLVLVGAALIGWTTALPLRAIRRRRQS